ncbi:transcriptional modulator of MazE/toxin MazF [Candidatus Magnetomorum sp. HK-1]|nr:transcriptional modulator of MazE/toxin MazF [Candidatus Magnetomorum sp. HK-1]
MKPGQIVLFNFPKIQQKPIKLRPALMIAKFPTMYDDWLICMISSNLKQYTMNFDEIIDQSSHDFIQSGLKTDSVIRVSRLAVVEGNILNGAIGNISQKRLMTIKQNITSWLIPPNE